MKKIILASTSPRRKQLMKQLGIDFTIVSSKVIEKFNPRLKPRRQAEELSLQKAEAVAGNYPDAIIIGADTLVAIEDEVLGKPKDEKEAKRMLKKLSGTTHKVITGITIIDSFSRKTITKSVETTITFRTLYPPEIASYIQTDKPFDKAGSYAIQDRGALFIERIEGDYFGTVGLPLFLLAKELKKLGVAIL
ncbi:septum formation inhibitor Maf [Candidatus Microgenomates bacterium]|nr:septum formation inhibitor Maf [Candidatus Microgenomates bacterium]